MLESIGAMRLPQPHGLIDDRHLAQRLAGHVELLRRIMTATFVQLVK